MSELTYAVTLDRDEKDWLTELIEEKKLYYEKELGHVIGDDREWYLRLLPIAERVEQEFDTMFAMRPDSVSQLAAKDETISKLREGLEKWCAKESWRADIEPLERLLAETEVGK